MTAYYQQVQFLPILLLLGLAAFLAVRFPGRLRWTGRALLGVLAFPAFLLPGVLGAMSGAAVANLALLWGVLLSLWVLSRNFSFEQVLDAFAWAGVLCAGFVFIGFATNLGEVRLALAGSRMTLWYFHPNLLAFMLVGFGLAQPLGHTSPRRRALAWGVFLFSLAAVFLLSSRASLVAYVAAPLLAPLARLNLRNHSPRARRLLVTLPLVLAALVVGGVYLSGSAQLVGKLTQTVDKTLYLSNEGRGLQSGASGRFEVWRQVTEEIQEGAGLIGVGYRETSNNVVIDNGYLVLLYESGLVATALFALLTLLALLRMRGEAIRCKSGAAHTALLLLIAFLVNNVAARYLVGVGNAYSLMMMYMILAGPFLAGDPRALQAPRDVPGKATKRWRKAQPLL